MSEILQEVDEELRREQLSKLWHRFGSYAVGISVAIVLGTVVVVGWKQHRQTQSQEQTKAYIAATELMQQKKYSEAEAAFQALREDAGRDFAAIAAIKQAQANLAMNKGDEAMAIYKEVGDSRLTDIVFRDLARLLSASLAIEVNNSTAEEKQAMQKMLEDLASPGRPFAATAQEMLAVMHAQGGDMAKAKEQLISIASAATTPPSLRQRANELMSVTRP